MKIYRNFACLFLISVSFFSFNEKSQAQEVLQDQRISIEMVTNYGTIVLELYNETPLHRDNFIKLVNEKAYDSLLFHRVIQGFMIQGGDPDSRNAVPKALLGEGDLGYTIPSEFHTDLFHQKGALATARDDNQARASSGIQFYIVQGKVYDDALLDKAEKTINERLARYYVINDPQYSHLWESLQKAITEENDFNFKIYNDRIDAIAETYDNFERYIIPETQREVYKTIGGTPTLDRNYTVFGQVIDGIEVVDAIAAVKTDKNDRPEKDVKILSVRILK